MTGQLTDMGAAAQIFWPLWERLLDKWPEIVTATWETLQMVLLSTVFSLASGFLLAILMIVTNPLMSLRPCRPVYQVVDFVVNLLRSFPFIILLIAIIPVTRLVVGTSIGLPGIWVLAAVTVGGSLWGIAGMLFAVPVCSILHALLRLGVHRRLEAQAAAGASVPAPTPEEKM